MNTIYIRRSLNGKTFAASAASDFPGLSGKKCPFTGDDFENEVKEVKAANSEIMGLNFAEIQAGVQKQGLYFGRFKINLGETMVMD
ncbi:MAG: hypothetical protein V1742_04295 [Pseudomonadota bacterium]